MREAHPRREPLTRLEGTSPIRSTLSHKGRGEASEQKRLPYGANDTGEKSTNQLFGCTKPFTFGLIARGETSWAT
jgi:hypothetical protein